MAYVMEESGPIPVASGFPLREPLDLTPDKIFLNYRVFYDDKTKATSPLVVYFPGSGQRSHYEITTSWIQELLQKGYMVLCSMNFRSVGSSERPWPNGYGNVTSPLHHGRFIKEGHVVNSVLKNLKSEGYFGWPQRPIILLGHSLGSMGIFTWSAYGEEMWPECREDVKCLVGNGATSGGLGDGSWNAVNRVIAGYSNIFRKITHPSIALYADSDKYCPSDFSRRLQMTVPPNSPVYFISPGNYGHNWFSQRPLFLAEMVDQLYKGKGITVDGVPAIAGTG